MEKPQDSFPELKYLDTASDLLDSRFRIPGTNIRFGFDFLVGLVPYVGDVVMFAFSGLLMVTMARRGASGMVILKMLWNILLDAVIGAIPILGDLFDLQFKANRRNYALLLEHYEKDAHEGSAWPVIIGLLLVLVLLLFLIWALAFWMFVGFAEIVQALF